MRTLILLAALLIPSLATAEVCPKCGVDHSAVGVQQYVVNRDQRAYDHALREAQILAARHSAGHPLGVAPGCRYSGTGYTYSPRPHHCYYGELPESRLVARACVVRNGAYFWSAHYR